MFPRIVKALGGGRGGAEPDSRPIAPGEAVVTLADGRVKAVSELERGDVLAIEAGGVIPSDGTVIEGCALVDESAVTGESAPGWCQPGSWSN
jgi:potassium-transporting ATPase ATP-binding subunit